MRESTVEPSPSWREALPPQHRRAPAESSAQVCHSLAETAAAASSPLGSVGEADPVVVPLPNLPDPLQPQQRTVASASSAQGSAKPAVTATDVPIPRVFGGIS